MMFAVIGQARATIVNFDDLLPSTYLRGSGYAGLTWEIGNAGYSGYTGCWKVPTDTDNYPHSPLRNAINSWGCTLIGIGFPQQVNLTGAYFAAQGSSSNWTTGVRIHGYQGGNEIAVTSWFNSISDTPAWFPVDLAGVDRIVVESVPVNDGGGWFGMDDLTYTVVPEPSALAVLATGMASLLFMAWRRRQR